MKCRACGKQSLEGYITYSGICKHEDDLGDEIECDEILHMSTVSCMSAILRKYLVP